MWDGAFRSTGQWVTHALVRESILSADAEPFEKISAAIALRTALNARQASPQSLLFIVPEATPETARHITTGLLVGSYVHGAGHAYLPEEEKRDILKQDVVLVTQSIAASKGVLEELDIASNQKLKQLWPVESISQLAPRSSNRPRVFLANPGRLLSLLNRRFGAVIIDASHPRTYFQLATLLNAASRVSALRIAVAPPMSDLELRRCGWPKSTAIWTWEPRSKSEAAALVSPKSAGAPVWGERHLRICPSDPDAAEALARIHKALVGAMKAAAGQFYPGMTICWSIYHRLRQLTVALVEVEQAAADSWGGSLHDRIKELDQVDGHSDVAWDTTWPELRASVDAAYDLFLSRGETAKFHELAACIRPVLQQSDARLRVVTASEVEVDLLRRKLAAAVTGIERALDSERLEIVNAAEEARLISIGNRVPTVLLGPRPGKFRHLDAYASERVEVLVYPHEVAVEQFALQRAHGEWMEGASDTNRIKLLEALGLKLKVTPAFRARCPRPTYGIGDGERHRVAIYAEGAADSALDVDALADESDGRAVERDVAVPRDEPIFSESGDRVDVSFVNAPDERFASHHWIDVFFGETEKLQRYPVTALQPGWQVIRFVDAPYDALFDRLNEAVNARTSRRTRTALDLWHASKDQLMRRHASRVELHEHLRNKGLTSSYGTMSSWFDLVDGNMAPQQYDEFAVVASQMPAFADDPKLMRLTFDAVQHERGSNRKHGRTLRKFLRSVVTGGGGEDVIDSARKINAGLADLLSAVHVREVKAVRITPRSS